MKKIYKVLSSSILGTGLVLSSYSGTSLAASNGTVKVQLLGVNDIHGQLDKGGNVYAYGKKLGQAGPAALLSSYLDKWQADFSNKYGDDAVTLRFQAGDMVGASPAVSGLLQDEPTIKTLNAMKFQVGTLGNHEFDEGLEEFNRIFKGEAPAAGKFNKAVEAYPHEASTMDMVISNVNGVDAAFGWHPYVIKEVTDKNGDTAKIGVIGVVTEEIPTLVLKKQWEKYTVTDPAAAINKYSKELKAKGVNAIVVLAHAAATSPSDNATEVNGEIRKIIDNLDSDSSVDLIMAAHNHVITNATYKGVRVVEGASHAKAFDNVELTYNTTTNDFEKSDAKSEVVPVLVDNKYGLKPDPKIEAIAQDAADKIKEIVNEKIATAKESILRKVEVNASSEEAKKSNANMESPLGNLITDAQLKAAKDAGFKADFAITNDGGIRADLEVTNDGIVTWGAAQKVQPFGNIMQVVEISGKNLIATLNSQYNKEETYFLQMAGIGYSYKEAPAGTVDKEGKAIKWVVDKAWIEKDGKKTLIDENKTYTGVINDFLYGGGDDFPELKGPENSKIIGALDPDTDLFVKYLKAQKELTSPALSRKVYFKDLKEDFNKQSQSTSSTTTDDYINGKNVVTKELPNSHKSSNNVASNNKETKGYDNTVSNNKETKDDNENNFNNKKEKSLPNTGQRENSTFGIGILLLASAYLLRRNRINK